jgi:DNA-binding Lrp family transcriptional regulator
MRLAEMMDAHRSYAEIAAALGRTETAVRLRRKRRGMPALSKAGGMTINRVALLLGIPCAKTVTWWAHSGWLPAHDIGMRVHSGWVRVVEMDDLLAFLEEPKYWHLWQVDRIKDTGIREWALEMRAGVRFLTTGEVGERLGLCAGAVHDRIQRGLMKAVKRGFNWLVREEDAVYVEPGTRKGLLRPQPLTPAECALVRRYWGQQPVRWISQRLGRTGYSKAVYNAAVRMGLPRLGNRQRQEREEEAG